MALTLAMEKPTKEGYLCIPPKTLSGQLKKTWIVKYCQLFSKSKQGIERLEVFDTEDDALKSIAAQIITLENCIKISPDPQQLHPYAFVIFTKSTPGVYHFSGSSVEEMWAWVSAFQSVAFKDNISRQTIEEDNDLYCSSSDAAGVFQIRLISSEASERCGLIPGEYTLVVNPAELQLRNCKDHSVLLTWPYRFIRRYGQKSGNFTFEAGRKCASGEGLFSVQQRDQHSSQEIFRCVSAKMKQMKSLLRNGGETIVCGDNQFQHALGMTPRSRSPLPPSPTSTTPIKLAYIPKTAPAPPPRPLVNKPNKPPRKYPPNKPKTYDDIEPRSEAWKTMGVDTVAHTERSLSPSLWRAEIPQSPIPSVRCAEGSVSPPPRLPDHSQSSSSLKDNVFVQPTSTNNYDRLQHFGSTAKLESTYKQVNCTVGPSLPYPPSQSVEEPNPTQVPDTEPARLADDSHHGYGVIRKKLSGPLLGHIVVPQVCCLAYPTSV